MINIFGGNNHLKQLINDKGVEYARVNYQLAILEFLRASTDDEDIITREQYWKNVLVTHNPHGYNGN